VTGARQHQSAPVPRRCAWCGDDPLYVAYHDHEWGEPLHDERRLFEMLVLEGAQAGLSWLTILRKREHYRRAFSGFDAEAVARYGARDVAAWAPSCGITSTSNRCSRRGARAPRCRAAPPPRSA
jgi:DNA-3-methyladenine glycosylase I